MNKNVLMVVINNFVNDYRVTKESKTLGSHGYNVLVFALHKAGFAKEEIREEYKVKRFYLTTKNWPKKRFFQVVKYIECCIRMTMDGVKNKPSIIHAHDLGALPIGYVISKLSHAKLIYDSHELWFDSSHKKNFSKLFTSIRLLIEKVLIQRANAVITVSDSIADFIADKNKISRPYVIRNLPYKTIGSDTIINEENQTLKAKFLIPKDRYILLYQGGISANRGLETLIEAMPHIITKAVLVLIGDGVLISKLRKMIIKRDLGDRVFFHNTVTLKVLWEYTKEATIGISPIEDSCLSYHWCLPNKMFEYIQAGLPVVVTDLPEMAKIINKYKVGKTFPDGSFKELANTINSMLENTEKLEEYRAAARRAALDLNWENEEKKLIDIYKNLTK